MSEDKPKCWNCVHLEEYDVNDYKSDHYCEKDLKTYIDRSDGHMHPINKCEHFKDKDNP